MERRRGVEVAGVGPERRRGPAKLWQRESMVEDGAKERAE